MSKIIRTNKILKTVSRINIKTIVFNLKYLPFEQAVLLPIFISRRAKLLKTKGEISINGKISPGLIQIGYGNIGVFDKKYSRSILEIKGKITFGGKCRIGHGSKLSVSKTGHLTLGDNFSISAETTIICHKKITIGKDVLLSWDVLIMDTDLHKIKNKGENHNINPDKPIFIGDKVWVGARSLILKGAKISNDTIIAANSTVLENKIKDENVVLGGNPLKVLKKDVEWDL